MPGRAGDRVADPGVVHDPERRRPDLAPAATPPARAPAGGGRHGSIRRRARGPARARPTAANRPWGATSSGSADSTRVARRPGGGHSRRASARSRCGIASPTSALARITSASRRWVGPPAVAARGGNPGTACRRPRRRTPRRGRVGVEVEPTAPDGDDGRRRPAGGRRSSKASADRRRMSG